MERSLDGPDIAVAVLDRCWLTGSALGMLIDDAAGFRLAGAFREADEVMRASRRTAVSVVVANLDGVSGPFADDVARLHRRSTIPVAVVVPVLDAAAIAYAVETQVEALLPRDERPSAIFAALRQVAAGHVLLPRGWQQALAAERAAHAVLDGLSRRQREIFELLAEGRPNHEIAHRLSISVNTVKFHVRCIYEQLGIRSRLEAARMHATL